MAGLVLSARPGGDPSITCSREVVDPLPEAAAPAPRGHAATSTASRPRSRPASAGCEDAAALLALLEERRAFLAPADGGPGWRRHHRMLRAALQRRAASRGRRPAAADLHRRAAAGLGRRSASPSPRPATTSPPATSPRRSPRSRPSGGGEAGRRPPRGGLAAGRSPRRLVGPAGTGARAGVPALLPRRPPRRVRGDGVGRAGAARARRPPAGRRGARAPAARRPSRRAASTTARSRSARELVPRLDDEDARLLAAARVMLALLLGESCRYDEAEHELAAALDAAPASPLATAWAAATRAFAVDHPQGRRPQALAALDEAIAALRRARAATRSTTCSTRGPSAR